MLLKSCLFSHAVCSPDVGISIPVQNMVENSLEKNGPKILLPQIVDAVTALHETAQEVAAKSTTDSSPPKQVDNISADGASGKSNPEMGTLDLPLPISIPGLNVSTKKEGGGGELGVKSGKKESAADTSKAKAKTKASVEASGGTSGGATGNKEAKQGLVKVIPQKAGLGKAIGKEKTKQKEKDSRSPIDEKEESKEVSPQNEDDQSKEKGKGLMSGKVKKTPREEKLDQKEKESEKHPDRKGSIKEKESSIADLKEVAKKESSGKKDKDLKDGNKSELTAVDQTGKDVISKDDPEDSKHSIKDEVEVKGSATGESGGSRGRRKQLAPKRRSARLASLNEESPDEQTVNEKDKSSTEEVNVDTSAAIVLQETGKKKASAVTVVEKEESSATLRPSGHKKLCVLESNSDEESVTTHQTSSEEEKGYESETEQSKEEEVRKQKRKRAREGMKRAGNREAVQSHINDTKRLGQKRSLDACGDDQGRRSNSPVTKKVKNNGKQLQDETKLSPAKQKSPSPVVVTR